MKRLNKKKFITRKTTKINKLQTEPDAKKLTAMGVMRNAMTTRAPGGANNKTCSINQFAKMFHTLFGLLNTNLKLLG